MSRIWAHTDLPVGIWLLLAILALLIAGWSVSNVALESRRRWCVASCRFAVLVTVLAITAQLYWAHEEALVEQDVVLVLADRSGSMNITEDGVQRDAQLRYAVDRIAAAVESEASEHPRRVQWFGFNDSVNPLSQGTDGRPQLPPPSSGPSMIGDAVQAVVTDLGGAPLAGVILLTDGRGPLDAARRVLRSAGSGVWVVPIGDQTAASTITIIRITTPHVAFLEDTIPVSVELQGTTQKRLVNVSVHVRDEDGTLLGTTTVTIDDAQHTTVVVPILPDVPGLTQWIVEVVADGRLVGTEPVQVDVRDHPLGLLLVEGTPRFLHRFMVPVLTRESTINASIMLQSAHPDAAPEGNTPIRRIPETTTELAPFDLIVIGDVDPRSLTESQTDALLEHVLDGAGLLWMPGPKVHGSAWAGSSLEALHPVPPEARRSVIRGVVERTVEGIELGLPDPPQLPLEWSLAVEDVRPQARALMTTTTPEGGVWPTLLLLPTGKGRVGWLGTDDLWRWRRTTQPAQGDAVIMAIIRLLARHVAPLEPMLRVLPDPVEGQHVSIVLEGDVQGDPPQVEVDINDTAGAPLQRVILHRHGSQWRGLWLPARAGTRQLTAGDLQLTVEVASQASEDMQLGVDVTGLQALITETGGAFINADDLDTMFAQIPHRSRRTTRLVDEGPAGSWALWLLLVAFLTLEWGLRRWNTLA